MKGDESLHEIPGDVRVRGCESGLWGPRSIPALKGVFIKFRNRLFLFHAQAAPE